MGGPRSPFGGPEGDATAASLEPEILAPEDVLHFPDRPLYDPDVLRTIFLQFPGSDWEEELADFHRTDVEVPADMTVDGKTYPSVGVRFQGNTSYMMVPAGRKKSLNISIDHAIDGQRLYGHRTLNLLNAHMDPSFLRTVLYHRIGGEFFPVPRANLVKVVINGESWGIYVNVEQFNKDFLRDGFGTEDGARWKVPQDPSGSASLRYRGEDVALYERSYELKTKDGADDAWEALIRLMKALDETSREEVEAALAPILDIDETLWFLALDNVLLDDDGYGTRGSDFLVYLDPRGRFHMTPYDNNETFRSGGMGMPGGPGGPGGRGGPGGFDGPGGRGDRGGGRRGGFPGGFPGGMPGGIPDGASGPMPGGPPGGFPGWPPPGEPGEAPEGGAQPFAPGGFGPGGFGPGGFGPGGFPPGGFDPGGFGPGGGGARLDPLARADDRARPLIRALLSVPHLRARYLAHVRTLAERWLDWEEALGPAVEGYRSLLGDEVAKDTRKLDSIEAYEQSVEGAAEGEGPGGADLRGADRRGSGSLRRFAEERRSFLLAHAEVARSRPAILAVRRVGDPGATAPVAIAAEVGGETPASAVLLRYSDGPVGLFAAIEMRDDGAAPDAEAGDGVFTAEIPAFPAGALVRYYVEARGPADPSGAFGTTFDPEGAEGSARTYRVRARASPGFPVRINEVLAAAPAVATPPEGADAAEGADAGEVADPVDWIELHNASDDPVDLSGIYLSDDPDLPRTWRFPNGTSIEPRGFLIVLADGGAKGNGAEEGGSKGNGAKRNAAKANGSKGNGGNGDDGVKKHGAKGGSGLRATFRLSRQGESLWLVDRDDRGNSILDRVIFGETKGGASHGRLPDGKGELRPTVPTPGGENRS